MKLFNIMALVVVSMVSLSAHAADKSNGCGLGWEIVKKESLASTATRQTTNAFLPNTFSMTFGTSGCSKHSIVKNESEQQYFVEANLEQLTLDMARGEGEYLRTFAAVMGCEGSYSEFSSAVQNGYSKIVSEDASSVLNNVKREISPLACGASS